MNSVRQYWVALLVRLFGLLFCLFCVGGQVQAAEPMNPEDAFKLGVQVLDTERVRLTFEIAPGYYMYKEQFKFSAQGQDLVVAQWPEAKRKFDETYQKEVETYRGRLSLEVKLAQAASGAAVQMAVTGQGCADLGLCYPPITSNVVLPGKGADGAAQPLSITASPEAMGGFGVLAAVAADKTVNESGAVSPQVADGRESGGLGSILQSGHWAAVVGGFFVAGLLLSFTPCVLPMLPILSSIIVGQGTSVSRLRGGALAASYSLGMALVYTALGVAAGLAGEGLAAHLQKPWVLVLFALMLVGASLSMFGVYEIQLPARFTGGVNDATQKLPPGRVLSVLGMGGLSALIVSPCVAAPLAGALLYISQTRDVWLGGMALFSLAAGMSVPLLLLGVSAGTLLPRAGPWMEGVKYFFGIVLLAVALWTVQPVLAPEVAQLLWGVLLVIWAASLGLFHSNEPHAPKTWVRKTVALLAAVVGVAQFIGAATGGTDPLRPLAPFKGVASATPSAAVAAKLNFRLVKTEQELDEILRTAGQPVMLDFYADWCVSCKEMERFTFSDARVQATLSKALLLKADVTANNADDRALLRRFKLFGPPGILFFDAKGQELAGSRVIGFQDAERFLQSLGQAGL
ncbi:protein-disulfide reductase DsbD [Roseateles sp. BYS180W]|uniref:Thiol:disulfide interchange protein DsbD n=1 Tax=Roseateles rivi TaxID=3299028 RepID=A0ABW7FWJ6_9BURK